MPDPTDPAGDIAPPGPSGPESVYDLTPDDHNANRHTERGMGLLEDALRRVGAGRGVLVDRNNKIIAGNGVIEAATNAGITRIRVIETTGNEIVVTKRTDVDRDSTLGEELALGDNLIGAANQDIDARVIQAQAQMHEIDLEGVGISDEQLRNMLEAEAKREAHDDAAAGPGEGTDAAPGPDAVDAPADRRSIDEPLDVQPVSLLDTRQGWWQQRKRQWAQAGLTAGDFDPVLAEVITRWYTLPDWHILDPFSRGPTKGIVAAKLGRHYSGLEVNQDVCVANARVALGMGLAPSWAARSAAEFESWLPTWGQQAYDFAWISVPPESIDYLALEAMLRRCLKPNRFAALHFPLSSAAGPSLTFNQVTAAINSAEGLRVYDQILLAMPTEQPSSFARDRLVTRTHQSVVIFYNGDVSAIADTFRPVRSRKGKRAAPSTEASPEPTSA